MKDLQNQHVFFDVDVGGTAVGRITFELFFNTCKKTCENFRCLCTGEKGIGKTTGKPLHYKGVIFHKVIKGLMVQSGDFSQGNGEGGESIYGGYFDDESFDLKHDKPFLLSMAGREKNTNGSQFYITTQPSSKLDGAHVVFGRVVDGTAVVKQVESQKTDSNNKPLKECKIVNCGEVSHRKRAKKRHKKRSVSVESFDQSFASGSEDRKSKKKKKKRKKEKKKHKKKKKNSISESPSREEDTPPRRSTVPTGDAPDVPSNRFLSRVGSKNDDRSSCTDDMTPTSQRSQGKRWTSRSGRKIKGRGSVRYRTPSRSRSRSSIERPHNVTHDRAGSDTPPHWRQAQKGQRPLQNVRKSALAEDKWHQDSNSPPDKDRLDGWDSDVGGGKKSTVECWSGEESDEREKGVAAMVRRHLEKKLSKAHDDEIFGPVAKPNVSKRSKKSLQKQSRKKLPSPETKDVTRSKWDTPERHSRSLSIDQDVSDADERSKDSANGRIVSGVVGYEKLLESQKPKPRHKHKKKKKVQEPHKSKAPMTQSHKKKKQYNDRKRSRHRRSSTSSYSSHTSSNDYRRQKRQRRNSFNDSESPLSESSRRSSYSVSERYTSSRSGRSLFRSEDSRSRSSFASSNSASDSSLSTSVRRKSKSDVKARSVSRENVFMGVAEKKLHKKNSQTSKAVKPSKQRSVPNERKLKQKKPRKDAQLSWQPPLEFGEEIEEETTEIKIESKHQKKNVAEIEEEISKEVKLGDKEPAKSVEAPSKNGDIKPQKDDLDDIDAMLSSALDVRENPVKTMKKKNDLKQKLLLLQQATAKEKVKLEKTAEDGLTLNDENKYNFPPISNSSTCPATILNAPVTDTVPCGFGFIPKYEPPKIESPPKVVIKKIKSPSPENQVQDVGIWSDEETEKNKTASGKKLSKSNLGAQKETTKTLKVEEASHPERLADVKQEHVVETAIASPVSASSPVLASETSRSVEKIRSRSVDVEEDNDTEENDLLVHEPVTTAKKPFVFNIKLPKPETEPSKPKKKRKKQKKLNKKHKNNKEKDKNPTKVTTDTPVITNSTSVDTSNALSTSSTSLPATSAATTSVTSDVITNTAQLSFPPPNVPIPQPTRAMGPYNPYYPMPHPYMGPRGMVSPGHMYPHHFHPQFMGFHPRPPMLPVGMGFQPALPDDNEPPPLPCESEPEKPPEPVYDVQRLSDQKVAAMFASQDITKESVEKFFDENKNLSDVPSPASSRSSSLFRKRRRRKRRHRSRHRRRSYSSMSHGSSSRSRRSYSSDSSSYSPSRRRSMGRSSSSDYSSSRSQSSSSSLSRRGRRSRSRSYFSVSSSSRDRWRSTSSYSSSGSDIDRPCRHYRPGRRQYSGRSRHSSYNSSSDRSDWSRRSSRTRPSRSWSRDRSLSRSSFSSRYTHSD